MSAKTDALVVGAGPVGLSMAAALAAQGLRFRLIDAAAGPASESRAIGIQPRTLEVSEMCGLVGQFLDRGHRLNGVTVYGESGAKIGELTFDHVPSRYSFLLTLPQSETERILSDHLQTLGIRIERQTTLQTFEESDGKVLARISLPSGAEDRVSCDWLIGCDGAHSRVREVLGLQFSGKTYDLHFLLADVHAESALPDDQAHIFSRRAGLLAFFPLGHGRHRLVADNPPERFRSDEKPSLGEWQEIVNARASVPMQLMDPNWTSNFRVSARMTENLRRGRAFVIGDAAHIHSPALAQGMNTGIQDAWNLAWKIALVQKSLARPRLLDSFEVERMPVERRVLQMTDFMQKVVTTSNPASQLLRDTLAPFVTSLEPVQEKAARTVSQTSIEYRASPIVEDHPLPAGPRAGDRAPDGTVFDHLTGRQVTLLSLFGKDHVLLALKLESTGASSEAQSPLPDALRQELAYFHKRYSALMKNYLVVSEPIASSPTGVSLLIDWAKEVAEKYGTAQAFYLVRPDGYVAFRCSTEQPHLLQTYLSKLFSW